MYFSALALLEHSSTARKAISRVVAVIGIDLHFIVMAAHACLRNNLGHRHIVYPVIIEGLIFFPKCVVRRQPWRLFRLRHHALIQRAI